MSFAHISFLTIINFNWSKSTSDVPLYCLVPFHKQQPSLISYQTFEFCIVLFKCSDQMDSVVFLSCLPIEYITRNIIEFATLFHARESRRLARMMPTHQVIACLHIKVHFHNPCRSHKNFSSATSLFCAA
jgi:hypothetical protein